MRSWTGSGRLAGQLSARQIKGDHPQHHARPTPAPAPVPGLGNTLPPPSVELTLERLPSTALRQAMVQHLGRQHGNAYVQRYLTAGRRSSRPMVRSGRAPASIQTAGPATVEKPGPQRQATVAANEIAFVREEGLNLRAAPDQHSTSLRKMKFGQRVHTVEDPSPQPSWLKIAVLGQTGYAFAPRIHVPPAALIQKDPALRLIKVRSGLSFWALVKEMYGIEGNENTKDQNMNHFINAIRAWNKDEAFAVKTDMLDDVGNFFLSGRDAKNTYLKANYDLWVPSFGVAAKMDVGSGTVRGELTRLVKKIEQKIDDFKDACRMSLQYMPEAIARRAGDVAGSLLQGLLEFAKDAVKILAVSTAVGALIGALFGGVGAIPGAEIGFEVGLLILKYYGLATLIEAVLGIAVDLVGQLAKFISLVWGANGDKKQLDLAARALADAIGILVSAILVAVAAYLLKKGGEALGKTKFAQTVGETRLAEWFKERQQLKTTKTVGKDLGYRAAEKVGIHTVEIGHATPWDQMTTGEKNAFKHSYSGHSAELGLPSWAESKAEGLRQQFNARVGEIRANAQKVVRTNKSYGVKGSGVPAVSKAVRWFEFTDASGAHWYYYETLEGKFISAGRVVWTPKKT